MGLPFPSSAGVLVPEWFFTLLAGGAIGARLYLHAIIQKKNLTISDGLITFSWVLSVVSAAFDVKFAMLGLLDTDPSNDPELTVENIEFQLLLFWVASFPFFTAFYLCKAALLAFYAQMFPFFMHKRRMVLWAVMIYTAASWIITMVLNVSLCTPIRAYWTADPAVCVPNAALVLWEVTLGLHFTSDLMLFGLPFLVLYKLQMTRKVKLSVYGTFLLGLISLTTTLTRYLIIQLGTVKNLSNFPILELLSALELNISIIIACLPSLRPYLGDASKKSTPRPQTSSQNVSNATQSTSRKNEPRSSAGHRKPPYGSLVLPSEDSWTHVENVTRGSEIELSHAGRTV